MAEAEGRAERGAAAPPANAPPLTEAQREVLAAFWQQVGTDASRVHVLEQLSAINLPLARIKKIMKSDEDVRMISSEAPALFAKACELFVLEVPSRVSLPLPSGVSPPSAPFLPLLARRSSPCAPGSTLRSTSATPSSAATSPPPSATPISSTSSWTSSPPPSSDRKSVV